MTCPICGGVVEVIEDEVDIGVGVQKFLRGIVCATCGEFAACDYCGALHARLNPNGDVTDYAPHATWCESLRA